MRGQNNLVFGVVRLENLEKKNLFSIGSGEIGGEWQVIFPSWWKAAYGSNKNVENEANAN